MRHCLALCGAASLFLSPVLGESLRGEQQQPPPPRPGVQVGVPEGRGGAPANPAGGGRGRAAGPPAAPAPRNADGRAIFWTPGKKGVWLPGGGGGATVESAGIPFQPWAKAVYADRLENQLEPHTRCKPSGGVRQFLTPYGVEMVELPEMQRVFIFDIGGPHTYRTIYMDGRSHPADSRPPSMATRSAGGKATRSRSRPRASTRASGSIGADSRRPRSCGRSRRSRARTR